MKTSLHLVSMPWADPELPSIQISVLKSYVDAVFGKRVLTKTYSAFASIALEQTHRGYSDYANKYDQFEEYPYFLLYFRRFLHRDARLRRISIGSLRRSTLALQTKPSLCEKSRTWNVGLVVTSRRASSLNCRGTASTW
jgi:hypothetical protein